VLLAWLYILFHAPGAPEFGRRPFGLRKALAGATQPALSPWPAMTAKMVRNGPPAPPEHRTADVDALFPRLSGLEVLPDNWLLNGAAAQRLGFSAAETRALNEHFARFREQLCDAERNRMKMETDVTGGFHISIPEQDDGELRRGLWEGIETVAGNGRASAAGLLWSYAKDRAETDFAGFGRRAVWMKVKLVPQSGGLQYVIDHSESVQDVPDKSSQFGSSKLSSSIKTVQFASFAIPARYAHLISNSP
jgi:hypothetical protein